LFQYFNSRVDFSPPLAENGGINSALRVLK
jgi:hypothetical protein